MNIYKNGYGLVYREVMKDPEIPLISKAIYAYLCAYPNKDGVAFPNRDRITEELDINKDTFTKHMRSLVEKGHVAKKRTPIGNTYSIQCDHLTSAGYGRLPKLVMNDRLLSAKSKAVYAYLISYAGSAGIAFPASLVLLRDLDICASSWNSYMKPLLAYSYVEIEQFAVGGRFQTRVYRLPEEVA